MFAVFSADNGRQITAGYPTVEEAQEHSYNYNRYQNINTHVREIPFNDKGKAYNW